MMLPTPEINLLDLFSGIGGFSKGLSDAGFKIKNHYFSEVDKHAIANYKHNFKDAKYLGSVTDVRDWTIERPNIITFGSPCQDFSLAGKRKGMGGERSSLISYAIMAIERFRPDVFIWENVKGTYSSNNSEDFWAIMQAFANLDGYRLEQQLLNTSWFLPQNRERIYTVGHASGRSEPGVFPISENDFMASKRSAETPVVNCLTAGGNSGGMHSSMTLVAQLNSSQDGKVLDINGISQCLSAGHGNSPKIKVSSATSNGYEIAQQGDSINFSVPSSKTRRGRVGKGVAQTLDTACNQGVISVIGNIYPSEHEAGNIYDTNGISPTIKCNGPRPNSKNISPKVVTNGIRRLTEVECERLQGYPDNWTEYGDYDGIGRYKQISKTQRYKMCGNAVTVSVVKEIAKRLIKRMKVTNL